MMSIQQGKRAGKLQPASAPGGLETRVKSSGSSVSGDEYDNPGDSTLVKKQRRREKNRASAQQSRQRKKFHLETLEIRVEELERDKAQLQLRMRELEAENRRLRGGSGVGAAAGDVDTKSDEMVAAGLLTALARS